MQLLPLIFKTLFYKLIYHLVLQRCNHLKTGGRTCPQAGADWPVGLFGRSPERPPLNQKLEPVLDAHKFYFWPTADLKSETRIGTRYT